VEEEGIGEEEGTVRVGVVVVKVGGAVVDDLGMTYLMMSAGIPA